MTLLNKIPLNNIKPAHYLFVFFMSLFSPLTLANLDKQPTKQHLDRYDALELINQGKYKDAKDILLKEEENTTDLSSLCSIYKSMLEISSATNNDSDGAKYAALLKQCYVEGSDHYVFLDAQIFYFKKDYEKTDHMLDQLAEKINKDLAEDTKSKLHSLISKNILSSIYVLKASILLINNEPKKVEKEVIYFAEKSHNVIQTNDTSAFLASVYHFYGNTSQLKVLQEKNTSRPIESYVLEEFINKLNKK